MLAKRKLQGMYKSGTIYMSGEQPSSDEILDDMVHEVAHHVETLYEDLIYSDNKIKLEFLNKSSNLKKAIESYGIDTRDGKFYG